MAIPHAIIFLGKSLSLHLVAEGVETEREFEILSTCGCSTFQGYLFAKPMPEAELAAFIDGQLG